MSEIVGTNIIAPIVPMDSEDTFPTHLTQYQKGGWRAVETMADRDAIHPDRHEDGMVVYVKEADKQFQMPDMRTVEWIDITVTKNKIGLDKVDNTSDIDKPISIAQQEALSAKANTSQLAAKADLGVVALKTDLGAKVNISDLVFKKPVDYVVLRTDPALSSGFTVPFGQPFING